MITTLSSFRRHMSPIDHGVRRLALRMIGTILTALVLLVVIGPVPAARALDIRTLTSPQGIPFWLVQVSELPVVTVDFAFAGGTRIEPAAKAGAATLASGLLVEGAGDMDGPAFQDALAARAVEFSTGVDRDAFSGSFRSLATEAEEAAKLVGLALAAPRFDADDIERDRRQLLVSLARSAENPQAIASRSLLAGLFPTDSYGRDTDGTRETVAALTREDLVAYVSRQFTRNRLTLGVVGDITPEAAGRVVDLAFAGLPAGDSRPKTDPVSPSFFGETVVDRPIPQTIITFALPGILRSDPDWFPAFVMNHILGGGTFTARLFREVRETRGLAYSVGTTLYPLDRAGLLYGYAATRNDRARETVQVIRDQIARFAEEGPTEAELAGAKKYLTGSFPLSLDGSGAVAGLLVTMQIHNLPPGYLDDRSSLIEAVTADDVKRVAKRLLDTDKLSVVMVGQPADGAGSAAPAAARISENGARSTAPDSTQ
ncbi:pitrilysin family protein [Tistrella mobilis]|uniref:M16 family metallopeptidase n=1 Tax=Tistrella mobilis TaxID=171437 RepID=UPI003557FB6F